MLSISQSTTKFVPTSTAAAIRRITYTRYMGRNFILTGVIEEERQVEVKRWPGIVVTEYRVRVTKRQGQVCFSEHWVNESDVLTISEVAPACPRCNDTSILSIRGDETTDCPCSLVEMEVTF